MKSRRVVPAIVLAGVIAFAVSEVPRSSPRTTDPDKPTNSPQSLKSERMDSPQNKIRIELEKQIEAGSQFSPGNFLVKLTPAAARIEGGKVANYTARPVARTNALASARLNSWRLVRVPSGDSPAEIAEVLRTLSADPNVVAALPDYAVRLESLPNDPYLRSWGSLGQQAIPDVWSLHKIRAPEAWGAFAARGLRPGQGVVVAVVDSGLDLAHPDLRDNLWVNRGEIPGDGIDNDQNGLVDDRNGYDFLAEDSNPQDENGHGTHVAGTIAAVADNGIGIAGLAYGAQVMAIKVLNENGVGALSAILAGVDYAIQQGAKVINFSLGMPNFDLVGGPLRDVLQDAYDRNIVCVAAAGNGFGDDAVFTLPAALPTVITVAASDPADRIANFSNGGPKIDVAAPGGGSIFEPQSPHPYYNILSLLSSPHASAFDSAGLVVGSEYLRLAGTSMATPHVAGVAAALRSAYPNASVEEIRQALRAGAVDIESTGWDMASGYGRADLQGALETLDRGVCTARILSPAAYEDVADRDVLEIRGVAAGGSFASFELEYGTGPTPSEWTTIAGGLSAVPGGVLGRLRVSELAGSQSYCLRLRVQDSLRYEFVDRIVFLKFFRFVPIPVATAGAANPVIADFDRDGTGKILLVGQPSLSIVGADGRVVSETQVPVSQAQLGLSVGNVVPDPEGRAEVFAESDDRYGRILRLFDDRGNEIRTGAWPLFVPQVPSSRDLYAAAPMADLDGDGFVEIVRKVGHSLGVYDSMGRLLPGFPFVNRSELMVPVVGDLDGDGRLELVVTDKWGRVTAVGRNGSPLWSTDLSGSTYSGFAHCALLTGDVDRDGRDEIVVLTGREIEPYHWEWRATLLGGDGSVKPGWPVHYGSDKGYTSTVTHPAVGDLDGDGDLEIVVATERSVTALHHDGSTVRGWPRSGLGTIISSPVVGDVNADGVSDVVVTTFLPARIVVFGNGSVLHPGIVFGALNVHTAAMADLDGDGAIEIAVAPFGAAALLKALPGPRLVGAGDWPMFQQNASATGRWRPARRRGDVNGDGRITLADAALVSRYVQGVQSLDPEQIRYGDVLRDGRLSLGDARAIAQSVAGARSSLDVRTGDVNGNGRVDEEDAALVQRLAAGHGAPTALQRDAADVNADGSLTAMDALEISQYAQGIDRRWP